jgi:protein-disulfide isomerase
MESFMRWKLSFMQTLVLLTALIALVIFVGATLDYANRAPDPVRIETKGQPTLGAASAKVEVIVFEDFRCETCRDFNEKVFPKIQEHYIASGQVRYTFIPLGFLEGSKPIGNAALAVYKISPSRFFLYADALFRHFTEYDITGNERAVLLELAGKVGGIDLMKLKEAIQGNRYYDDLDQNFHMAMEIMGHRFGTPALFVNGIRTSPVHFIKVQERIDRALYQAERGKR